MSKALIWLAGILGIGQLFGLFLLLTPPDSVNENVVRFEQAGRCMEKPRPQPLNSEGIAVLLDQPALVQDDCWQTVTLPENNPIQEAKVDLIKPKLVRTWYRVRYNIPDDWPLAKPLMVFVPRIIANAWQIRIKGQPVADNRFDWRSTWNRPLSATFFAHPFLLGRTLDIEVGVIASMSEGFSIARVSVGDAAILQRQKAFREYIQVIVPQALSAVMLLLGLFFLSFWLVRRAETEYLYLTFASLAFAVLNLRFTVTQPDNTGLDIWYNALLIDSSVPWLNCMVYLFIARFTKLSFPWIEKTLWLQAIIISLITLSPISFQYDTSLIKGIFSFLIAIIAQGIFIWKAISGRNIDLRITAAFLVFGGVSGFHDTALNLNLINPEGHYIAPYTVLAQYAGFLYIIQRRYVAAIMGQEQLNADLVKRLAERDALTRRLTESEAELRAQQQRLIEFERAQTLAEERQRLMHDMHDGLGSSLLTTLAAIEKNSLPQQAVADALRACIEDLRLVIDSLEPAANDLVTLLGTIRYRLGQRLDKAGLELQWEITDLPPLFWLEPPDALNVLRLVQEALVNVLKHANASRVHVMTRNLGDKVEIRINDNGCGFDPKTITVGRGLLNQYKRTERLGGRLQIKSVIGQGTTLSLHLPVNRNIES